MNKKIAIVNTQSSFNTPVARESVDLALIFGAFDHQVSVFFIENAVYQLIKGQNPESLDGKDFLATMKAFELYDIEQVLCCSDSLSERAIDPAGLINDVELAGSGQIAELLHQFDHVLVS